MVYSVWCTAVCSYVKSWGGPSIFFGGKGGSGPPLPQWLRPCVCNSEIRAYRQYAVYAESTDAGVYRQYGLRVRIAGSPCIIWSLLFLHITQLLPCLRKDQRGATKAKSSKHAVAPPPPAAPRLFVLQVLRIQGGDASRQSLVLGSNCRKRSLTKASTNGVVALNACTAEWRPYRRFV